MTVEQERQRVLVLTGASRGIGHATVKRFSAEGWRVLTCSRHGFDARCPWPGGEANHVQVDLADPRDTLRAIEVIREKLEDGKLDALVNNAGISPKGEDGARLDTIGTELSTWAQVFHVNFFAPVVLARGLRDELAGAGGAVVNVTSIAGARVHPFAGAAYATSKAALAALTREMAHDFGPLGVRVNAIAPGEVETSILSPGTDRIVAGLPMRRLGQPEEVADVIHFLCSGQSAYVTGTEIEVNGGQHV
ncbi:SDR family NAD(P)-dependent oxidoreductase [Profundibacterium mesophilum]|uniref:Short-chain alcohol dehydrogenase n=1 Tax=Profundibacterium mesophilum KAUST100406-0324 TaxID=1037889 RepID=A0A921NVC0_9RHOB|nr:SDR family oxidoreductase [Profundibacterium mesophilum]KAF0676180.1 Short-chain alcohol dehydrogenase [Profundibacterium mesophilum KAUST100406-0324]